MHKLMLIVWLGGVGMDGASTHIKMSQGYREAVLTQSIPANDAIIGVQAVGGAVMLEKLYKTHPKLAVTIGIVGGALRAGVGASNLRK